MELPEIIKSLEGALEDEIRAGEARPHRIFNGVQVGRSLFRFDTGRELNFPDSIPCVAEIDGDRFPCTIYETRGLNIILEFERELDEFIPEASLTSNLSFLLRENQNRLKEITEVDSVRNGHLVLKLLGFLPYQSGDGLVDVRVLLANVADLFSNEQLDVIRGAIHNEASRTWAPPACGKTRVVGGIVRASLARGETVLFLGPTHKSVNEGMLSAIRCLEGTDYIQNGQVVRVGAAESQEAAQLSPVLAREIVRRRYPDMLEEFERLDSYQSVLQQRLTDFAPTVDRRSRLELAMAAVTARKTNVRREISQLEAALIVDARALGMTLAKASVCKEAYTRAFDLVVIDEAGMASLALVAFAASLGQRVVVLGDFRQLGAIVLAKTPRARRFLGQDVFAFSGSVEKLERGTPEAGIFTLHTQHRMHSRIRQVVSRTFYQDKLVDGERVMAETVLIAERPPFLGQSLVFCDVGPLLPHCISERRGSHFNVVSLLVSLGLCTEAVAAGASRISLLSPYTRQAQLLRTAIRDLDLERSVRAGTVHVMQGSESDVVIFDFCDSPPLSRLGKPLSGGLGSSGARLLCTAISRARGKLMLVGDWQFLLSHSNGDAALRSVLDQLGTREIHALTATNAMNGSSADPGRISWYSDTVRARRQLMHDICSARAHILINAPSPEDLAWIDPHWFDGHDPTFVLIRVAARLTPELTLLYEEHGAISAHRPGPEFIVVVDSIIWRWPTGAERSGPVMRAQLEITSTFVRQLLGLDKMLELEV